MVGKRESLNKWVRGSLEYFEIIIFQPNTIIIVIELLLLSFKVAKPNQFQPFIQWMMNFHTLLLCPVCLFHCAYPLFSQLFKFKPEDRSPYPKLTYNVPNKMLGIFGILAVLGYKRFPTFSIIHQILGVLLYYLLGQNDIIQGIISVAMGIAACILYTLYGEIIRLILIVIIAFISGSYLTKRIQLSQMIPKEKCKFNSYVIKNIGFLWFDVLETMADKYNCKIYTALAFIINFICHLLAQYCVADGWYDTSKDESKKNN